LFIVVRHQPLMSNVQARSHLNEEEEDDADTNIEAE
jgi:hypothetical protein